MTPVEIASPDTATVAEDAVIGGPDHAAQLTLTLHGQDGERPGEAVLTASEVPAVHLDGRSERVANGRDMQWRMRLPPGRMVVADDAALDALAGRLAAPVRRLREGTSLMRSGDRAVGRWSTPAAKDAADSITELFDGLTADDWIRTDLVCARADDWIRGGSDITTALRDRWDLDDEDLLAADPDRLAAWLADTAAERARAQGVRFRDDDPLESAFRLLIDEAGDQLRRDTEFEATEPDPAAGMAGPQPG